MDDQARPDEKRLPPEPEADEHSTDDDEVEEASEDSFPASDPPSFTGATSD